MKETLPTVPLSGDDKEILQTIYSTRYKYFIATYGGFLSFLVYYMIRWDEHVIPDVMNGDYAGATEEFFMRYGLTIAIVLTAMTVIYMKRIRAYSKDYKGGCKECVPYVITMKQYFGNTGQYFYRPERPELPAPRSGC